MSDPLVDTQTPPAPTHLPSTRPRRRTRFLPRRRVAAAGALLLGIGAHLPSASAQRSERAVRSDMDFARELASRYQYVDLAESVLEELSKLPLTPEQKNELGLVQCQVYSESAKREGDPALRLSLFEKAAGAYRGFLDAHKGSALATQAERSYLSLVNSYGRALELAIEEAVGDEAARLREEARKMLEDAVRRTGDLKDAYDKPSLSEIEKLERGRLMLERSQMLITLGNVSPDPIFLFRQAETELGRVASELGETSALGLNAMLSLAKIKRAKGAFAEGADFAEFVAQTAVPVDPSLAEWQELPFEVKAERFRLVELAIPDLVESAAASGNATRACTWSLYFFNTWKREGFQLGPFGYLAQLAAARTLLDAGGYVGGAMALGNLQWFETEEELTKAGFTGRDARSTLDLALASAQEVNAENKGNVLQVRAQKMISDVTSRPGISVSPEVLFEAAMGEYNTGNHARALESLKGVMRSLDSRDEATRQQFAPRVLFRMGTSLAKLERPLEAAMAFREAATAWGDDPEYQERIAQGFYASIGEVRKKASGDPLIDQLYFQAEQLITETQGSGANDVKWRQAERTYEQQDFAGARTRYLEVGEAADEYEKAQVKAALCLYKAKDFAGAEREFRRYLEEFVPDPEHAITGARKRAVREEARAQATFYLGRIAYDAQRWDDVLAAYADYADDFPEQTEYGPNALYMLVGAHLARKDLEQAKRVSAEMQERFANSANTGKAALNLYQALKQEQESAGRSGDAARALALKREMAGYMRVSNQTAADPSFGNVRIESSLWLELGAWTEAEAVLRRTLQLFQGQAERTEELGKFVLPDLGAALLGQQRVPEAFEVLDPLVPKEAGDTRKPASAVTRDWCRSVSGWVEGAGPQYLEIPGVGGEENYRRASELLDKLVSQEANRGEEGHGAWSCPWYELKFEQLYLFERWGELDSSQKAVAKRLLEDLRGHLGDPDLKAVATSCGDEALRKRFQWLGNRLR